LAILAAANQVRTNAPNFTPPPLINPGLSDAVANVIQNMPGSLAVVDFPNNSGAWNGGPFNVYTNAQFSALTPSQRQTGFIHELHHVAVGYGMASAVIDGTADLPFGPPTGPYADFQRISDACGTQMINPPKP